MKLGIETYNNHEIVDITYKLEQTITGTGLVNVFVKHTTAALAIANLDPGTDTDLAKALDLMSPKFSWSHPNNSHNFSDHLWSTILGNSLIIPYDRGKLALGAYQRIILIELNGPKIRDIVLTFINGSTTSNK